MPTTHFPFLRALVAEHRNECTQKAGLGMSS